MSRYIYACTCQNPQCDPFCAHPDGKVMKLSSLGVNAVRVVSSEKSVYYSVLSREYNWYGYWIIHVCIMHTYIDTCSMLSFP